MRMSSIESSGMDEIFDDIVYDIPFLDYNSKILRVSSSPLSSNSIVEYSIGKDDSDIIEVPNIEGEFLVNGNQGEDFITGIGNIVYRGGQDDDFIAVSQGEVYGDKGADLFFGVTGDGYAVIQDYTIGEDAIALAMDGEWNNVESGLMYTDSSGEEVMLLVGIDDVQQIEAQSIGGGGGLRGDIGGNTGSSIGGGGGQVGQSIGDGGGWLL